MATLVPRGGALMAGRDHPGRMLRLSVHPDQDRVLLSVWQSSRCVATVRLASADVPDLVRSLTAAALTATGEQAGSPTQVLTDAG